MLSNNELSKTWWTMLTLERPRATRLCTPCAMSVRGPTMLEELCKRIQPLWGGNMHNKVCMYCWATLRRSQNKRNVGSCWLKSLTGFKLCATTRKNICGTTCNRVWKRTQHVTSNNVASVCTGLKAACKRTQHCWPITPNIVGCYMLRPFAFFISRPRSLSPFFSLSWASQACRLFFSVFLLQYIPNLWTWQLI